MIFFSSVPSALTAGTFLQGLVLPLEGRGPHPKRGTHRNAYLSKAASSFCEIFGHHRCSAHRSRRTRLTDPSPAIQRLSHTQSARHVSLLQVRSSMLRSSAPLHLHHPKYWRPRPAKNIATVPIHRGRCRAHEPQDRRYCGPDQSIDSPGDGRPCLKPEGKMTTSEEHYLKRGQGT